MADKRFIIEIDPNFVPEDGTRMHALIAALEHFNIPTFIKELPDEETPPKVIIELDGGLITEVISDRPVDYLVQDYDLEGVTADKRVERPSLHTPGVMVDVYKRSICETAVRPEIVETIMQVASTQDTD